MAYDGTRAMTAQGQRNNHHSLASGCRDSEVAVAFSRLIWSVLSGVNALMPPSGVEQNNNTGGLEVQTASLEWQSFCAPWKWMEKQDGKGVSCANVSAGASGISMFTSTLLCRSASFF